MTEQFGPYELVRKVAQGGMAEVFLATQKRELGGFSKQVAIKRIFPHLAEEPDLISMFFDEARIAASLSHPNVVQIYDLGQIDEYFYIAMEFVHGRDLRSVCERGLQVDNFLPLEIAVKIVAQAAMGLAHAHDRLDPHGLPMRVVHRDVSPQNVLISMGGHVKVCDFGIAKAEARLTSTRMGQFKGKFSYMSPEQAVGDGTTLDGRSDLFSLGIVLYEITACTRLFRGKNDYDTIRLVAEGDITRPSEFRPDYPKDLEAIVLRALERDPNRRFQTGEEFAMELERWLVERRALVSPSQVARYMSSLFPELSEQGSRKVAEDSTVQRTISEQALVDAQHSSANQGFRAGGLALRPPPSSAAPSPVAASEQDEYDAIDATRPVTVSEQDMVPTDPIDRSELLGSLERDEYEQMEETGAISVDPRQRQELMSTFEMNEYDELEATGALIVTDQQREELRHDSFADRDGSFPGTPLDDAAHHAQPAPALAREAQGTQDPNLRVDPRGLQWTPMQGMPAVSRDHHAPAPSMGAAPQAPAPHGLAAPPVDSNSSFEFQLRSLRESDSKKKLVYAGVGVAALFGVVCFGMLIWLTSSTEPEAPQEVASAAGAEAPISEKTLERVNVQLDSSPSGARVVVNGILQKDLKTPAYVSVIKGEDNEVILYKKGHSPSSLTLDTSSWDRSPVQLEPIDAKKASTSKWTITTQPRGAKVFVDGREAGTTPLTVDALPGVPHHVLIERSGNLPYQGIVELGEGSSEHTQVSLDEERDEVEGMIDLAISSHPKGAKVLIGGEESGATPTLRSRSSGKLLEVSVEARGRTTRTHVLDTSTRGTLALRVELPKAVAQRGTVSITGVPSGAKVYIGNTGYASSKLSKLELKAGRLPIVVQTRDGRRVESTLKVEANAHTNYAVKVGANLDVKRR